MIPLWQSVTPIVIFGVLFVAALSVREKYRHPFYWAAFVVTGKD